MLFRHRARKFIPEPIYAEIWRRYIKQTFFLRRNFKFKIILVVYIDLSGNEPHRQVAVDKMVGNFGAPRWCDNTLVWNASYVGLIPTRYNISHNHYNITLVAVTMILYKLCTVRLLNLLCVYYIWSQRLSQRSIS